MCTLYFVKIPRRNKLQIVLVVIFTVLSVYGAELFLVFNQRAIMGQYMSRETKLEKIQELRAAGKKAYPSIYASHLLSGEIPKPVIADRAILPFAGISNVPTVLCDEGDGWLVYESDEYGFNNPKGLYRPGLVDVMVVGDSFAHGACVGPDENAAALIRKKWPHTLNLGMSANGFVHEMATIMEYGPVLKPKTVLWMFYEGNDLASFGAHLQDDILKKYIIQKQFGQNLMDAQDQIDRHYQSLVDQKLKEGSLAAGFESVVHLKESIRSILFLRILRARLGLTRARSEPVEEITENEAAIKQLLALTRDTVGAWGGRLYFVSLPSWASIQKRGASEAYRSRLFSVVQGQHIPVINIYEHFIAKKEPRKFFNFPGSHYNKTGYKAVAEKVISVLEKDLVKED
ncbi:MAG: SGNH/GDSL hydrolase family protein [Deltaproteobacteria bacterium]|nr:SGNH/GDSL hydrolase family protein [Deltaproteobacteria bacterium]